MQCSTLGGHKFLRGFVFIVCLHAGAPFQLGMQPHAALGLLRRADWAVTKATEATQLIAASTRVLIGR